MESAWSGGDKSAEVETASAEARVAAKVATAEMAAVA